MPGDNFPSQFQIWLSSLVPDGWGKNRQISNLTGLEESAVSRHLNGREPRASTLQKIADHRRQAVWELVAEIETRVPRRRMPPQVSEVFRQEWTELFEDDTPRARRVLLNLKHQEELGYTDLVSAVVREIISHGPIAAVPRVVQLLFDFKEPRKSPQRAQKRRIFEAEYKSIQ